MVIWLMAATGLAQDEAIFDDVLATGWQDWSWNSAVDAGSATARSGVGIEVVVDPAGWGALSWHRPTDFGDMAALRFWMQGDSSAVDVRIESVVDGVSAPAIAVSSLAPVSPGQWTEVVVDLTALGAQRWDRISWMDGSGLGTTFHLDDIWLLEDAPSQSAWTGAEPIGSHGVVLHGAGDPVGVSVSLNGAPRGVYAVTQQGGQTYLTLDQAHVAGTLEVVTANGTFTRTLRAATVSLPSVPTHRISDWIYGVAFPPDAAWVRTHGVTVARWGGNAKTCYNPAIDATNAGVDWYFENRSSEPASGWISWLRDEGVYTWMSVPALDWVAKDTSSYSYPVSVYGAQQDTDPWNGDAGNGVLLDGTHITWNDPSEAYTPWSSADAEAWLGALPDPPTFASVDNELDITGDTHRDVHPEPLGYDELLARYSDYSAAIRSGRPGALLAAPSSCCWWFFWNSAVGPDDKAAHGDVDLLQWFLRQVAAADQAAGARSLDMLDIHYYPDGVFNDQVDPATRALRLRSTRSLWDPTYTDEGWIGTDEWATQTQPSPNQVQLIPRMQALIDQEYPGTQLGLTEWNFGAEGDNSGGLAVADALGVFGRQDLDLATHWTTPAAGTPAAAAFWLYRDAQHPFGTRSLPVDAPDPDRLSVHAALDDADRLTVVLVNKDPDEDVVVDLGLPAGNWTVRHFGGQRAGDRLGAELLSDGVVTVPAYGAVFLGQLASPYPLMLEVDPLVAGAPTRLEVRGAEPGETVWLALGDGVGDGVCPAPLGGLCLDILGAPTVLGSRPADGSGVAVFTPTVPAGIGLREAAFQAVVLRGAGGAIKSHPVGRRTVP